MLSRPVMQKLVVPGQVLKCPAPFTWTSCTVHKKRVQETVVHLLVDFIVVCEDKKTHGGTDGQEASTTTGDATGACIGCAFETC